MGEGLAFWKGLGNLETSVAADRPEEFPFREALPDPVHWACCRDCLPEWQRDEQVNNPLAQHARAVDGQHGLAS